MSPSGMPPGKPKLTVCGGITSRVGSSSGPKRSGCPRISAASSRDRCTFGRRRLRRCVPMCPPNHPRSLPRTLVDRSASPPAVAVTTLASRPHRHRRPRLGAHRAEPEVSLMRVPRASRRRAPRRRTRPRGCLRRRHHRVPASMAPGDPRQERREARAGVVGAVVDGTRHAPVGLARLGDAELRRGRHAEAADRDEREADDEDGDRVDERRARCRGSRWRRRAA